MDRVGEGVEHTSIVNNAVTANVMLVPSGGRDPLSEKKREEKVGEENRAGEKKIRG